MDNKEASWSDFLAPKYWPIWIAIGLLRLVCLLPFRAGIATGRVLGRILYKLLGNRRHITAVNISICFPELTQTEQKSLVRQVFENNTIGLIETGWAYWGKETFFRGITEYQGFELLDQALAQGNGVILMGAHYSPLDLAGLLFSFYGKPCCTLYRKHDNPMLEWFFTSGRSRFSYPLERKKTRQMLRDMRKNYCIWYAPDQDLGYKGTVFVPFFGHPAATTTATTKMHEINNSPLCVLSFRRKEDDSGYILQIEPLPGFPSGDLTKDAMLVNQAIENGIRRSPGQYMWVHKRFKTQPDGQRKLYKRP